MTAGDKVWVSGAGSSLLAATRAPLSDIMLREEGAHRAPSEIVEGLPSDQFSVRLPSGYIVRAHRSELSPASPP